MLVSSSHCVDGTVHESFNRLDHLCCPAVAVAGEIEGAAAKRVDERAHIRVSVHDINVLAELIGSDDGMHWIHALDIVGYEVKKEGLGVLWGKIGCGRGCPGSVAAFPAVC